MFFKILKNLIAAILIVSIPGVLLSDKIPKELEGFWSGNSCSFSIEKYALYIGKGGYLYEDEDTVEFNFVDVFKKNGWAHFKAENESNTYNYFYKLDGDKLIERYPPDGWDGKDVSFLNNQASKDTIYFKCKDKDPLIESKYGEALSLLESSVIEVCSSNTTDRSKCISEVFNFLDVNKDKQLHSAEINRGLRTFSLIAVLLSQNAGENEDKDVTFGVYLATVPFMPLFTQTLMANIDYNGSKSLSLAEISQDRADLFSAILSAKEGVMNDLKTVPGILQNLAPLLQGLSGLN